MGRYWKITQGPAKKEMILRKEDMLLFFAFHGPLDQETVSQMCVWLLGIKVATSQSNNK